MALSFGKALGYALKGTLEGFADVAEKEDEYRQGLTKTTYTSALKRYQELDDLRKERQALIDEEDAAVKAIMGMPLDGRALTQAEATKVYQTGKALGMDASEVLEKFTIASGKDAKVTRTPGTERSVLPEKAPLDAAMAGEAPSDGSLFSTGRYEQVDEETRRLLQGSGVAGKVSMPGKSYVEGVTLTPIADTDVSFDDAYLIDSDGIPTEQVTVKRTYNNRSNAVTVKYLSKATGDEIKVGDNQRVSTSAEAFDNKPFLDFGPLVSLTSEGAPEPVLDENGNVVYGYLMRNGEVRARRAGTISNEVVADAIVAGRDWAPSVAGGDLSKISKFEKLPSVKEFRKESADMRVTKQNNNLLFFRSEKRLDLHAKYGNRMYGPAGAFADFVTGTSKFVDGVVVIVNGLEDLANSDASLEEKIQFLESGGNIQELRRIADQQDTFLDQYIGTAQEIAMARVLDAALATVTAYDLAKQTGDTRISNNDFDQYIKTVSGNNAEQTVNLIKQGLESNLDIYKSKYENFTITKNSIPQYVDNTYLQDINRQFNMYDTPQKYENRINTMFKPFEEKQDEVRVIKTDDFDIMPVETDADGKQTRKVVMKDGTEFILRNPRFMGADKETIQQAIQKRLEAQAAAAQN